MAFIADILLLAAACAAAVYCRLLSQKLQHLGRTDGGLGGAVAALNEQVNELQLTINQVSAGATQKASRLDEVAKRADTISRKLQLLLISLHEREDALEKAVQASTLTLTEENRIRPRSVRRNASHERARS